VRGPAWCVQLAATSALASAAGSLCRRPLRTFRASNHRFKVFNRATHTCKAPDLAVQKHDRADAPLSSDWRQGSGDSVRVIIVQAVRGHKRCAGTPPRRLRAAARAARAAALAQRGRPVAGTYTQRRATWEATGRMCDATAPRRGSTADALARRRPPFRPCTRPAAPPPPRHTYMAALANRMAAELKRLRKKPPEGVCVWPANGASVTRLCAQVQGPPGTVYEAGVFRLAIEVPDRCAGRVRRQRRRRLAPPARPWCWPLQLGRCSSATGRRRGPPAQAGPQWPRRRRALRNAQVPLRAAQGQLRHPRLPPQQ
jgi:hypothetical protein